MHWIQHLPKHDARVFNTNLYIIAINAVIISCLAIKQNWTGKDILQIFIIGLSISSVFSAIIFIIEPKNILNQVIKLVEVLGLLVFLPPLMSMLLVLFSLLFDIDFVSAIPSNFPELKPIDQLSLFFLLPFIYLKHLYLLHTIPTICFLIQFTKQFLQDLFTNRTYLFSSTHPLGNKVLAIKFGLPTMAMVVYSIIDSQNSVTLDLFFLWFFIFSYFVLDLLFHLRASTHQNDGG